MDVNEPIEAVPLLAGVLYCLVPMVVIVRAIWMTNCRARVVRWCRQHLD